jgi:RNA polymerase sigma-70 factor (ECF subfamily)
MCPRHDPAIPSSSEQPDAVLQQEEPEPAPGANAWPQPGTYRRPPLGEFYAFDAEYLRRLSEGDVETESHFVDYFAGLLLIKLRSRLRSTQDVEDLRQEVFLRVLRALRKGAGLHEPSRLGAYVNSVCNNVVFEHFRQRARVGPLDEEATYLRSPGAGAEEELLSADSLRQVRTLLAELPRRDREILQAVFLDEQDKDVVCLQFGVRREYLRVLLHRAKARFRDLLKAAGAAGADSAGASRK